jgi:hypothetical protein
MYSVDYFFNRVSLFVLSFFKRVGKRADLSGFFDVKKTLCKMQSRQMNLGKNFDPFSPDPSIRFSLKRDCIILPKTALKLEIMK